MAFAACALLAACGSHHPAASVTTTSTSAATSSTATTTAASSTTTPPPGTSSTPTTKAVATTATTAPSATVALSDGDRGRTISVHRGDVLVVVLHSTYWSFTTPASAVVQPEGSPIVAPVLQGCVPGGGCGTVTARYRAAAAGSATLSAHRDSCGEALACTGSQGDWHVTVRVSA